MKLTNKDVLFVPIIIVLGKILSFVFNALLGSYFGAGKISDAFILAHSIPTILFEGVATALISCYIPIQRTIKYETPERMDQFNSNMMSISVLLSFIVSIIYFIFRHEFNRLYAKGFDEVSLGLLDHYTSILVWSIPLIGAYSIFRGYLQVSDKKAISSLYQVIAYLVLIVCIIVFYPKDLMLAWGTVIGNAICFVLFGVSAYRSGYRYRAYLSLKEDYIKTMLLMIFPIFFSALASEFASIIDKYFASQYSDGIITSMTYGYQLSFAMQGIVSTSLMIILFPVLSDKAAQKKYAEMNNVIYTGLEIIAWAILPLVAGGAILAYPIIKLLFGHGNFTDQSVYITSVVFIGYLVGVLPMCIKHVGDRVFFSLKKTKNAMITTFVTVGSNIILDYFMSRFWGYMGLVIATGIAIILGMAVSMLLIKKENPDFSFRMLLVVVCRPLILSIIMGIAVYFIRQLVQGVMESDILIILICGLTGIIVYFGLGIVLFKSRLISMLHIIKK